MRTEVQQPDTDDPALGVPVEVHFIVEDGARSLVLTVVGADALEIPFSRADAVQLIAALAEYAYPGARLRATPPAGSA
jgi:hypothetical protein